MTVTGRVHLLTKKQAGGPGVVGVENLGGSPRKVRVRLPAEDYSRALHAHDEDRAVIVEGDLEREGGLHWLYNSRLLEVLGPVEDLSRTPERTPFPLEGQTDILDLVEGPGLRGPKERKS